MEKAMDAEGFLGVIRSISECADGTVDWVDLTHPECKELLDGILRLRDNYLKTDEMLHDSVAINRDQQELIGKALADRDGWRERCRRAEALSVSLHQRMVILREQTRKAINKVGDN